MSGYYLGIDIGGSEIKYAISDSKLDLLLNTFYPTPKHNLESFTTSLRELIRRVNSEYPLSSIGIATPGTINSQTGKLNGINPNLPFWTDVVPADVLPPELDLPVFADNDANLMTLAEARNFPQARVVLGLTVGTGIGSGLAINGRVYRGGSGYAMELGHTCVEAGGEVCNCGLQGCVEAYSSLAGIRKRAEMFLPEVNGKSLKDLLCLAGENRELASVIRDGEQFLSRAIANAVITLDPDVVVIGGGCIDGGLYDIAELSHRVINLLPAQNRGTMICKALQGNQAGVLGALLLAINSLS